MPYLRTQIKTVRRFVAGNVYCERKVRAIQDAVFLKVEAISDGRLA